MPVVFHLGGAPGPLGPTRRHCVRCADTTTDDRELRRRRIMLLVDLLVTEVVGGDRNELARRGRVVARVGRRRVWLGLAVRRVTVRVAVVLGALVRVVRPQGRVVTLLLGGAVRVGRPVRRRGGHRVRRGGGVHPLRDRCRRGEQGSWNGGTRHLASGARLEEKENKMGGCSPSRLRFALLEPDPRA